MASYPDDEDGAVLAELSAQGVDMSRPLALEFWIAVPDEASAESVHTALQSGGYNSEINYDAGELDEEGEFDPDDEEFGPSWAVCATVQMVPEHAEILRIQADLDRLARPHGGEADGWGVMMD